MSLDTLFSSLYGTSSLDITAFAFVVCVATALALGLLNSWILSLYGKSSKSFTITLALIPAVVCVIIMMVNGNIGTGVAVAGAFSLVRFRSVPGSAREIGGIFISMGAGISLGMGYIGFAVLFVAIVSLFGFVLSKMGFGGHDENSSLLKITIPEDLNYTQIFDDLFATYTKSAVLKAVKTSNMGSMYKLKYTVEFVHPSVQKEFMDAIRMRNGNLEVAICDDVTSTQEL